MRLFLAIGLPDSIRRYVGGLQEQLKKSITGPGRWVPIENLHFTLKFLGEVDDHRQNDILAAFQSIAGKCFGLQLGSLAQLPPTGRADILSIDLANIPNELARLHESVEASFESLNFPRETRAFHPHLTLARLKIPRFISREIQMEIVPAKFKVNEILLMQSTQTSAGSTYQVIEHRELGME